MKSCRTPSLALALLTLSTPALCFAWGPAGHHIVAQIASGYLDPNARQAVRDLLGEKALPEIATWADAVRKQPEYKWSDCQHGARIAPGFDSFDSRRDCPPEGCAVSAIKRFAGVLRDKAATRDQRIEALKFLVHFVGDLHQPLHVTPKRNKPGFNPQVDFFGERTSLHKVWDGLIIERAGKPWQQYAKDLKSRITPEQVKSWSGLDPGVWATESYRLARSVSCVIPDDKRLTQAYCDKSLPVIEQRLSMAGVRLALLLNSAFAQPTEATTQTAPAQ